MSKKQHRELQIAAKRENTKLYEQFGYFTSNLFTPENFKFDRKDQMKTHQARNKDRFTVRTYGIPYC